MGFDPLADAAQTPELQRAQVGQLLLAPVQDQPPLIILLDLTRRLGFIALPLYVGWCQLFPRVVLPTIDPIPDDTFPTNVGYWNVSAPLPDPIDTAAIEPFLGASATLFHTHFSVTRESRTSWINGTPFSEGAPVFLPPGQNIAVFRGMVVGETGVDDSWCYLTAIASPRNEQILTPPAPA